MNENSGKNGYFTVWKAVQIKYYLEKTVIKAKCEHFGSLKIAGNARNK